MYLTGKNILIFCNYSEPCGFTIDVGIMLAGMNLFLRIYMAK